MGCVGIQKTELPLFNLLRCPTVVFLDEFWNHFYANRKLSPFFFDQRRL